jgi:1-pyrroline-4-hydroxy-2-carboxylate deaminase
MVLPPYVYASDWREMKAHVDAVLRATRLSCMLYNNPPAYKTDFLPAQVQELAAEHANLKAVKESSGDVRRVTAIKALCGERLALFVGLDDVVVEGVRAGAVGWIGGVTNALPRECMALFRAAAKGRDAGEAQKADALYRWLLPLLRMDTVVKFVQYLKLIQQEVGMGNERVRGPRMPLAGAEREEALKIIRGVLAAREKAAA